MIRASVLASTTLSPSEAGPTSALRGQNSKQLVPHTCCAPIPYYEGGARGSADARSRLGGSARNGGGQPLQLAAMSQQQQRRKPLLTVVVPGADVAPDRSHLEPRRSVHGARRSSVWSSAFEYCVRRFHLRALAWLCGALALALLLLLQAVRLKARHKLPLLTLGFGPTDEQARRAPDPLSRLPARAAAPPAPPAPASALSCRGTQRCCGPAPCAHEFIPPVVKASKRDPTTLESLACAWQPDTAAWQVTMVWSDEVMPRSPLSLGLKDALYRAMRLLRCEHVCFARTSPALTLPRVLQLWPYSRHRVVPHVSRRVGRPTSAWLVVRSRKARSRTLRS